MIPLTPIVVGTILSTFATGRWTIPLAAWIAPIFLLRATHDVHVLALPGIWLALYLASLLAYRGVIPVPRILYPAIVATIATSQFVPYAVAALIGPRVPGVASTLVFPLAWTALEFACARLHPYGTWGSLAYTQVGTLPLVQLASVTGWLGVTFFVSWFPAVVDWAWQGGLTGPEVARGMLIYAGAWGTVMVLGGVRLLRAPIRTIRVAGLGWPEGIVAQDDLIRSLEPNLSEADHERLRAAFARVNDALFEASRREARAGARVLVWPEASAPIFADEERGLLERARRFAREEACYLLIGMATVDRSAARPLSNKATLVDPNGTVRFAYVKHTAVPGLEARISVRGPARLPVASTPHGLLGAAICYDMDFPHFVRQLGRAAADVVLVPASDWKEIGHLHLVAAVFRAVENGAALLRVTRWGHSAAVDPFGRVVAFMDHFATDDRRMPALLPCGGVRTVYARIGDTFAWLCLAALVTIVAWSYL